MGAQEARWQQRLRLAEMWAARSGSRTERGAAVTRANLHSSADRAPERMKAIDSVIPKVQSELVVVANKRGVWGIERVKKNEASLK